jgi:hypothetical protein
MKSCLSSFYCFGCGIIGHSKVECLDLVPHDERGKLQYDVQLRALEERKRHVQSFTGAVAKTIGVALPQPLKPLGHCTVV